MSIKELRSALMKYSNEADGKQASKTRYKPPPALFDKLADGGNKHPQNAKGGGIVYILPSF